MVLLYQQGTEATLHTLFTGGNPTKRPDPMMQMAFATTITRHRVPGQWVATQPPSSMPKNCTAPPGISIYWLPSVSKPKLEMLMLAKPSEC